MHNWFETTIKYEKTAEEGKIVKVTEKYLVDALSFTEAEARIIKEMGPFISGEFTVTAIKRAKVAEIFENELGDRWFRAKVVFITLDEDKGFEKRSASTMMVQANDIEQARYGVETGMKGSMANNVIEAITETKIVDVYKYTA